LSHKPQVVRVAKAGTFWVRNPTLFDTRSMDTVGTRRPIGPPTQSMGPRTLFIYV
jgi:hypothetical protein